MSSEIPVVYVVYARFLHQRRIQKKHVTSTQMIMVSIPHLGMNASCSIARTFSVILCTRGADVFISSWSYSVVVVISAIFKF